MAGFAAGLNVTGVTAVCVPGEDGCCVSLRFD
jgi:hypothetical protein